MSTADSYGAVGIDLGTTYARIAVWDNDHVKIIPNDCGNDSTPSYVALTGYERILGDAAEIQAVLNPHNTVFNVKRLLGRAFSDPGVQSDIVHYPFTIFDRDSKPCIRVEWCRETREFTPEEILAVIFTHFLKPISVAPLHSLAGLQ